MFGGYLGDNIYTERKLSLFLLEGICLRHVAFRTLCSTQGSNLTNYCTLIPAIIAGSNNKNLLITLYSLFLKYQCFPHKTSDTE